MTHFSVEDLATRYGVHAITIGRWWKQGLLPPPVRMGRRLLRWPVSVIEQFDARRAADNNPSQVLPPS